MNRFRLLYFITLACCAFLFPGALKASTFEWTTTPQVPGGTSFTWYLPILVEQTTLQDALRVRDQQGNIRMTQTTVWVWNPATQLLEGSFFDDIDNAWSVNKTLYPGGVIFIQIDPVPTNQLYTIHLNGTPLSSAVTHTIKPGANMFAIPPGDIFTCASDFTFTPVDGDVAIFYPVFPTPTQTGNATAVFDGLDTAWLPDQCGNNGSVIYIDSNALSNRQWIVTY